jgi:hypothetical protein
VRLGRFERQICTEERNDTEDECFEGSSNRKEGIPATFFFICDRKEKTTLAEKTRDRIKSRALLAIEINDRILF